MIGSAVSRWTMLHFAVAIAFFVLAQATMVMGIAYPSVPLAAPMTLAAVHLLTIGWLTLLMLGALHQFVPVITAQRIAAGPSALVSLVAISTGVIAMDTGFVALGGHLPQAVVMALPAGGLLVLGGAIAACAPLGRMLWRTRPLPFSARFVAVGLVFLLATVILGILMGLVFSRPSLMPWPNVVSKGFRLHLLAGLFGWFALTAMGVSYRLLTMFTLAPEERGSLGTAVLVLSAGGLAATWLLSVVAAVDASLPAASIVTAAAAMALGFCLYLVDMVRLYRGRRRHKLELNTGMALPALAAFALCVPLAAWIAIRGDAGALAGPLAYLFLFGGLSGLGLSQLYKIVPFLTWLERYGSLLGKQPVPRVQDLIDERRDRPWFVLYFAAVAIGTVFGMLGWSVPWRAAIFTHLLATLMIVRALWLVRHRAPRIARPDASAINPSSMPPTHFSTGSLPRSDNA